MTLSLHMKKIGLALGGGGARGFAHIPMLEVIDDLGIELHAISGTSAGAIVASLYASGMRGFEIREWFEAMLIEKGDGLRELFQKPQALRTIEFLDLSFKHSGLLKGKRFTDTLKEKTGVERFEDLEIPLRVVASDFWKSTQVVLSEGTLFPAIRASMCLPGIFVPVEIDGHILIDGGGVNPVPHDILDDCDVVIAIDVMGFPAKERPKEPGLFSSVIGMFDVMQNTIIEQRLDANPPNLYLKPDIRGVDILDFHRSQEVYEMAEPAARKLQRWLEKLMENW